MKIYNAKLIGMSDYEGRNYYHFVYKSKYITGYGCVVVVSWNKEEVNVNDYYDIYMQDKQGYHNLKAIYKHEYKNTDRNTIDTN